MSTRLQPPADEHLDEERLARLLVELEFPQAVLAADWIDDLFFDLADVHEHKDTVRRWWTVHDQTVRPLSFSKRRSAYSYGCDCARRGLCPHVAAVLLCLAWSDPDWRPRFTRPVWEHDLLPLVPQRVSGPDRVPRRGHLRYRLRPGGGELRPLGIGVQVVRRAARGGRELKPAAAPRSTDKLREVVAPLHPWDIEIHRTAMHLQELDKQADKAWSGGDRISDVAAHLGRMALRSLARAVDLLHEGEPVTVSLEPVRPRIVATRTDTGLELHWVPGILDAWQGGIVLTDQRVLCPLAEGARVEPLLVPLPEIPRLQERAFVEDLVVARGLPVDLPGDVAGVTDPDDRAVRVLVEEEQHGVLHVRPVARYLARGEPVVVPLAAGPAVHADPVSGLLRRDLDWERDQAATLARTLGGPGEQRLTGDEALDFLTDTVPELSKHIEVFGERSVLERSAGELDVSVGATSGTDWFELQVDFDADGKRVSAPHVLKSWLAGARYHRLDDGRVVRLPHAWLERHGESALQVTELQQDGARLGVQAAWAAADLLEQAGPEGQPWLERMGALQDFAGIEPGPPPAGLQATLRDYQRRGLAWLRFLRDNGLGGVLADDMGLGKTVQVLALLVDSHAAPGPPSLVVAPTSVLRNWQREAARFTPGLRVHVHHGPRRGDIPHDVDVVLTTYALMRLDRETLAARDWRHVVLDEAQHIKNPTSQAAAAARSLPSRHRLALSGTPLENRLQELWSLFAFVMPGFFGRLQSFSRRYAGPIERERSRAAQSELRARIRPFLLRRLKHEVATELPPRTISVLEAELSEPERALYDRVRETYRQSVLDAVGQGRGGGLHILEALTRLRQAACHPALLPFDEAKVVRRSAKLDVLADRLVEAAAEGHQSLVFSQWPSFLKLARARLADEGLECLLLDGSTTDRAGLVDRFSAPGGPPVFLISIKAGGTGLNLTSADLVFHLDPWWNPAVEDQATDRAHRIGQTKPVMVYRIVATDTVEQLILELQERKRTLAASTLDADRLVPGDLSKDELLAVFAP